MEEGDTITFRMTPEVKALLQEVKALHRSERWVFANREGNVPSYQKVREKLKRSDFFHEKGICFHKVRKTTKTLGELLADRGASRELLRHAGEQVSSLYRDDKVIALHNTIPQKLASFTEESF